MVNFDCEDSNNNYAGNLYAGISFDARQTSTPHIQNNWAHMAETTMPLATPKYANASRLQHKANVLQQAKRISSQVITVNLVSLILNLLLALAAFYFAFSNDSPSTTAFAADCILDFISSAIVLWRYYGDLNSVYMHAREQIACIYLGALFEISALAIIIKALSDMVSGSDPILEEELSSSYELVYLAIVASVVCSFTMAIKCSLYNTLRDKSILLDVINTLISTVFALSIVMSQLLININPKFWYLDPILSIILAFFMAAFGLKVIHENFNILKPTYQQQNLSSYYNNFGSFNELSYQPDRQATIIPIEDLEVDKQIKDLNGNKQASYGSTGKH